MVTEEEAGMRPPVRGEWREAHPVGLGQLAAIESGKVGGAPAEGLVSVLWARGKAVHHHGHGRISAHSPLLASLACYQNPTLTSPASRLYLGLADFIWK